MATNFRLVINQAEIDNLSRSGGYADQAAGKIAGAVRKKSQMIITAEARVDNGGLRQSIRTLNTTNTTTRATYTVGSDLYYAWWQHEGVKGPIYPRFAQALRFRPKGSFTFVFADHVRGYDGIHYLTRALDDLKPDDAV